MASSSVSSTNSLSISTSTSTSSSSSTSSSTASSTTAVTVVATLKKRSLVPARWEEAVRAVGMAECREAALTLAHAFAADDYARYLVDDDDDGDGGGSTRKTSSGKRGGKGALNAVEEDKWRLHLDILTYTVASHCMGGLVTALGPECDSVAVWVPPGKHLDGWWTQLRSGMWRLYFQLSAEGKKRLFDEILPLLHDTKAAVLGDRDDDAWYLVYLGTKPNSQGRGYAARLLHDMIARADAENRPIYLESSSQANNAYYEKFGFEVKRDIFLERGATPVRLSAMVREPRPSASGRKIAYHAVTSTKPVVKKFGGVKVKGLMG